MDIGKKIHSKLEKILNRLKTLNVIQTFKLEINFCQIEENVRHNLGEIDFILKKCLKKIMTKPKKAELRNIITELVRKKNLNRLENKEQVDGNSTEYSTLPLPSENQTYTQSKDSEATEITLNCNICKAVFTSEKYLTAHIKRHNKKNIYFCSVCRRKFSNFLKLKKHKRKHFTKQKKEVLSCENSKKTVKNSPVPSEEQIEKKLLFNAIELLPIKSLSETIENKKKVIQPNKLENGKSSMKNDMKFICKCGKMFRLLKTLKKHERVKHSSKKINYTCTTCQKSFKDVGKLNRHKLGHQLGQYKCTFCVKRFARSDALKRHTSVVHFSHKNFSCSFCQKKFSLKFNKDVHEKNIHGPKSKEVECEKCGRKFRSKITFKCHFKIHSKAQFSCNVCGKSFYRKSYYNTHMKSKHFSHSSLC